MILKNFIIGALRKATYKWKPRTEALKKARISRGVYKCNICAEEFKRKEIQVDHIIPVVDVKEGFVDWNTYIPRMFPEEGGFQVICKPCHTIKTTEEKGLRKKHRTKKKKKKVSKK